MKFKIVITKTFEKNLKKLTNVEQKQVASKLKLLQTDPYYPSLRTKKIKGFQDLFECSVNMDIRILWKYEGANIIITLDIGHHTIVDKL
ncbi:type II toxin-antitoxin system mRNA interferase toxin, RelE/StbE family [Tissierella pigra]|jgi:mRNA interferase RelE/StbE|uniref:Type II toxin-antitoxin system mRNA interferase toxin, RelE/StbE family n=1 Tax=Tissierella pigra TaxID=2607614 RepID=A0A6N7Y4N7_9FIRM|nr:type II toxin-antitoxin system mRNA interferase toxin, RelE/StbE family [Tissierella pigra]MBU5426211.1 type II toxin-antitoxin system mRNA interferase toxin, RelE/StbE family [Tissierella pigra]MSU03408.1 type II toxin-antitoxin system mRNA interferase toxin, RelE/StbE family [Tissierella pigra]